ncbi:hypothetical protein RvY_18129 [Ramazzottius varieornatus]|uniref:NUDE domain-containing protein n=1 Tax=Ramazzottius varieornatus TaxID=947166 RepID=A0A1D1W6G0_RAMVA|nr:hypothetical protein RvY_18129 [Ramazzottius varieornatus]
METTGGSVNHQSMESMVKEWKQKYEDIQAELDDYRTTSNEYEVELNRELEQLQQQYATLKSETASQREEILSLKDQEQRLLKRIEAMEDQVRSYQAQHSTLQARCRDLEQKNDELETASRNMSALSDSRALRIETLIEEKALLESEVEDLRGQQEVVQRLRDEIKDLKDELSARRKSDGSQSRTNTPLDSHQHRYNGHNGHASLPVEDVERLHSLANGDFNHHNQRYELVDLADAPSSHVASPTSNSQSRTLIQSLLQKLTVLETKLMLVQRSNKYSSSSARSTTNGLQ